MSSRCLWPSFVGAFFLTAALSANAVEYPPHAESNRTTVLVHIIWFKTFREVDAACKALSNEPPSIGDEMIVGCYYYPTLTIYAVEPHSFNDEQRLEILGHEFWHALGAQHP